MDVLRFTAALDRIPVSRRWVVDWARRHGADAPALRTLALLTTEAVTNAIRHGPDGGDVAVSVSVEPGGWRVGVTDQSPVRPSRLDVDARAGGGRGVMLIDHLSAGWGVEADGAGGKTVWFVVARAEQAHGRRRGRASEGRSSEGRSSEGRSSGASA